MYVSRIQHSNKALKYIDRRIEDPEYRGSRSSQHNRYTIEELYDILTLLNKYAPSKSLLQIRSSDTSKRFENTPEEYAYAQFRDDVIKKVGKGSQDSIRKNLFVDMHRMGLIYRYNKKKEVTDPYKRKNVKYISLTDDGLKFINANAIDRAYIFTKTISKLLGNYLENTLEILENIDNGIDAISKYEFMFFVSAINSNTSFNININDCIELIKEYRRLSIAQHKAVIITLSKKLNPKLFSGNKKDKRDWNNWNNKICQIFYLFDQTPHFIVTGSRQKMALSLSTTKTKNAKGEIVDIRKQSIGEKKKYLKQHNVKKTIGYEFHHVIPRTSAESLTHYKLIDRWQNIVYIDGYKHAIMSQSGNCNVIMTVKNDDIVLSDFNSNDIYLKNTENILYDISKQPIMLKWNKQLLNKM